MKRRCIAGRRARVVLATAAALALAACGSDESPLAPAQYSDPAALVNGFATAFTARNAGALMPLLQPPGAGRTGFRFFPKSEELPDFDWLAGASWAYDREGQILSNMFDPTFASEAAGAAGFTGVGAMRLSVASSDSLASGDYDVIAEGAVFLQQGTAATVPVALSLRLVLTPASGGSLVIREMHELSLAVLSSVGPSFGMLQSWYRDVPPSYSDPTALITVYAAALTSRDFEAYGDLLDASFAYFPPSWSVPELPWMTGDSWTRGDELGMIRHMFDPDFQPPDSTHAGSVDSIDATFQVLSLQPDSSDGYAVSTHGLVLVRYDATSGAHVDDRFDFRLVSRNGHLLIGEIRELPLLAPGSPRAAGPLEDRSWAFLKAAYRS